MDIVDRLRQRIGLVKFDSDAIALHDAADIIEQLRGQVDFERECREDTYADLEKQDAEIERLREALQPFAKVLKGNWSHQSNEMLMSFGFGEDKRLELTLGDFRNASAALKEKA